MRTVGAPLRETLDRAAESGRTIRVWLRDDDCTTPTPGLDGLAALCEGAGLPVLLAVIPDPVEPALADWIAERRAFTPCQHGFAHANHAAPGGRPIELGGTRPLHALLADLDHGRAKLRRLFGEHLSGILVPPWNRIDPALVPHLPDIGFTGLSTIAPTTPAGTIPRLDSDLDIMDWRRGRVGRPLAELVTATDGIVAGQDRLGLLTHHLVHDATAWDALAALVQGLAAHPAVKFAAAEDLIGDAVGQPR